MSKNDTTLSEELSFLLTGAAWQDSLLQSYRSHYLTLQSILLAIGILLTVEISKLNISSCSNISINLHEVIQFWPYIIFFMIFIFAMISINSYKKIVRDRGHDVDFWHSAILKSEKKKVNGEHYFTEFKFFQKERRLTRDNNKEEFKKKKELFLHSKTPLEEIDICWLLEKDTAHPRNQIDNTIFTFLFLIWVILSVIVIGQLFTFILISNLQFFINY